MKIALAQIESLAGDIDSNVARHLAALDALAPGDADLVVFPELSLCAYEPAVADAVAIACDDSRLAPLEAFAKYSGIAVCAGVALATAGKPEIAAILFAPGEQPRVIRKAYLHADEEAFFAPGAGQAVVLGMARRVGVAICHDISVDAHIEQAAAQGMEIYVAGVAKSATGIAAARQRSLDRAREFRVPILVVNCSGYCEGKAAGGGSFIVDADGALRAQLGSDEQALLLYDLAGERSDKRRFPG
jgi:predicted amidohydrolase